jgi:hypothetical protein
MIRGGGGGAHPNNPTLLTNVRSPSARDSSLDQVVAEKIKGTTRELIDKLADSAQVRTCVANQMTDYLTGRHDAGACARQQVQSAFAASNHSVRDLLVEILAGEALTGVR